MPYNKNWYENNRKKCGDASKAWLSRKLLEDPDYLKKLRDKRKTPIKFKVLHHYSKGKMSCSCCNEKTLEFLTIDHINGGGTKHIKSIGKAGVYFYKWLITNNFPEGYQVLCMNCNWGRRFTGICPHNSEIPKESIYDVIKT